MNRNQYIDIINRMNLDYFEMLGNLRGNEKHKEVNLHWLTGNIDYIYFVGEVDADEVIRRMKDGEIPETIMFQVGDAQSELFMDTGLFDKEIVAVMAHELGDTSLPKPAEGLNIFKVSEITQLKSAGAILNTARDFRLFSFRDYLDMMNDGQWFYLAEYDGLPVGACMAMDGKDFLALTWIGTLPGYRKLGIAGHLMQAAERDGINRGKTIGVRNVLPIAIRACKRVGYREYGATITLTLKEVSE